MKKDDFEIIMYLCVFVFLPKYIKIKHIYKKKYIYIYSFFKISLIMFTFKIWELRIFFLIFSVALSKKKCPQLEVFPHKIGLNWPIRLAETTVTRVSENCWSGLWLLWIIAEIPSTPSCVFVMRHILLTKGPLQAHSELLDPELPGVL